MREEIFTRLPRPFPQEKFVLVVGPDGFPGLGQLKTEIQGMNRSGEWIRTEFRADVSRGAVTEKIALVLTMVAIKHTALNNMKKAAAERGIYCPNQALTVAEVKRILKLLSSDRAVAGQPVEVDAPPVKVEATLPEVAMHQPVAPCVTVCQSVANGAVVTEPTPTTPATEGTSRVAEVDDVEHALSTLANFSGLMESAQIAVLVLADKLKIVTAERDKFRDELRELQVKMADTQDDLETARNLVRRAGDFEEENIGLRQDVARLQGTLDTLRSLLTSASSK